MSHINGTIKIAKEGPYSYSTGLTLIANGLITVREAAARVKVGKTTLYEALKPTKNKPGDNIIE